MFFERLCDGDAMKTKLIPLTITCALFVALAGASEPARAGLIGYWNFDAEDATDLSGNDNDGTVGGNVFFTTDTPFGAGRAAGASPGGGSSRVITVPNSATLESIVHEFAISYWIKGSTADNNTWVRLFQKGQEGNQWCINRYSAEADVNMRVDTVGEGGGNNQNIARGGPLILDGTWRHMLFSLNQGQFVKYVDGQVAAAGSYNHGDGLYNDTRPSYIFGRDGTGNFVGLLDEVALWNQSLDPVRAVSIYNVPKTLHLPYQLGEVQTLWATHDAGPGKVGIAGGIPWWHTDQLPGDPPDPGEAYVHDEDMYVVLGSGTGVRTQRLIAAYGHENPNNRLQDDTGNGHTVTNVNNVAFVTPAEQPGFYYFNLGDTVGQYNRGEERHLLVPDNVYPKDDDGKGGSFTFTGLVNKTSPGGGFHTILSSSDFRLQWVEYTTWEDDPMLHIAVVGGATSARISGFDFQRDEWYFVALSYDQPNDSMTAFIQGASDVWDPATLTVSVPAGFNELSNFTLGRNVSGFGGTDDLDGMIDGARFYTMALSGSELEAVFFQYVVPEPSTLALVLLALCGLLLRRNR